MKKESQPQGVPDYLYDREATPAEIEATKKGVEERGRRSENDTVFEALQEENKWLAFIAGPDFERYIAEGDIRVDNEKNERGELTRIEIRNRKGDLLYYSTRDEFLSALERYWPRDGFRNRN